MREWGVRNVARISSYHQWSTWQPLLAASSPGVVALYPILPASIPPCTFTVIFHQDILHVYTFIRKDVAKSFSHSHTRLYLFTMRFLWYVSFWSYCHLHTPWLCFSTDLSFLSQSPRKGYQLQGRSCALALPLYRLCLVLTSCRFSKCRRVGKSCLEIYFPLEALILTRTLHTAAIRYELGDSHTYDFVEGSIPAEIDPSKKNPVPGSELYEKGKPRLTHALQVSRPW